MAGPENRVGILVETVAGQGTSVGSTFEELAAIIDQCGLESRIGVCVDTCHIFAAGYDIRTREAYRETMNALHETIGIDKVRLFHMNDSKKEIGSRIDRHEHIGKGYIGLEGFEMLLNDPILASHPMVIETPKGRDMKEDIENLEILRSLMKG